MKLNRLEIGIIFVVALMALATCVVRAGDLYLDKEYQLKFVECTGFSKDLDDENISGTLVLTSVKGKKVKTLTGWVELVDIKTKASAVFEFGELDNGDENSVLVLITHRLIDKNETIQKSAGKNLRIQSGHIDELTFE